MSWNEDKKQESPNKEKADWELKLEEKWDQFKSSFPNRDDFLNNFPVSTLITYIFATCVIAWLISGIYIVDQGNRGVVTRFEAYADTTVPGPHWHWPYPIEAVQIVNVENQRFIEIGYRSGNRRASSAAILPEALMLTKDENIVNISLAVQYQIKNAKDYLFNVKASESTLKQVTESVERGVIGRNGMDYILTEGRSQVVLEIKNEIQKAMDLYGTGLIITSVNLQDAQPPEEVQNAFEDAIRAREDKQRLINEAQAYSNEVIPKARGASARMIQEAEGYEARVVDEAKGETERFDQLLVEYEKAPEITRKRLYLEAKEEMYKRTNKVMLTVENGNSMFYMPLNQLPQATTNAVNQNQVPVRNNSYKTDAGSKREFNTRAGIRGSRSKK